MSPAKTLLLERVVAEVSQSGLSDRSLRNIAEAVGTSHRMLLHHFDSREGLVGAIVAFVEAAQRDLLLELASQMEDPRELILALWAQVSSPELRPFVRLFFECIKPGGEDFTTPWLTAVLDIAGDRGVSIQPELLQLSVGVTRGLLVDVLTTGDTEPATRSVQLFVDMAFPDSVPAS